MLNWKVLVAQVCLTLCDSMDCSPPGSSVHGFLQARILEWAAISFPRGSSWPRDRAPVSCTAGRFFAIWATREALDIHQRTLVVLPSSHTPASFPSSFFSALHSVSLALVPLFPHFFFLPHLLSFSPCLSPPYPFLPCPPFLYSLLSPFLIL